ncbi:MAG: radical SAM protein [Desulfitobacteriaceae bacterium]|nr:radical SAM protein [Desulfitobacteriaceae bacterium]MDD4401996.1 radical SAM protein [Desulfitobacteriaceae bacterium]
MINCDQKGCTGCGQCIVACPNNARVTQKVERDKKIQLTVDGKKVEVPERITILKALEILGYTISHHPEQSGQVFAPCKIGGCGACSVLVNSSLKPSCITKVEEGMEISTEPAQIVTHEPIRLANNFEAYQGGIIGAPEIRTQQVTEFAFFAQGCNLRCPACHNWHITFSTTGRYLTPRQAAKKMESGRKHYEVSKVAVSGGEAALNRPWLTQFVREFRVICADRETRLQLDTNASILTPDYIDELYAVGVSDISPDVKGLYPETYMKITGLDDLELAKLCVETTWRAVEHLLKNYSDKMFIVLAIPYHEEFISLEEMREIAQKIYELNPQTCISLIDYMPAFRCRDLEFSDVDNMEKVHQLFLDSGLHKVLWQTGDELPQAVDPEDILLFNTDNY